MIGGTADPHHCPSPPWRYGGRLLDIFEPTPQTVDALMKLDLPAGVDVEIKAFGKEHAK